MDKHIALLEPFYANLKSLIPVLLCLFAINAHSHGFIPLPAEGVVLAEWQLAHGDISPDVSTYPSIKSDLAALGDRKLSRNAAARLKWRGDEILGEAHAYLKDTSNPDKVRFTVSVVVSAVRNPKSIDILTAYVDSLDDPRRIYTAHRRFVQFGSNKKLITYYSDILSDNNSSVGAVNAAFYYFGVIQYKPAEVWIEKYNNVNQSEMTRKSALYLAARLGKDEYKEEIISLLSVEKKKFPRGGERAELDLLNGLVHITSKEEFTTIAAGTYVGTRYKDIVTKYLNLHKGSIEEKKHVVKDALFQYRNRNKIRAVIDDLVRMNDPAPLAVYWRIGNPAVHELLNAKSLAITLESGKPVFIASEDYDFKRDYPTLEKLSLSIENAIKSGKSMEDSSMRILTIDEYNEIKTISKGSPLKESLDKRYAYYKKKMSTTLFSLEFLKDKELSASIKESLVTRDRLLIGSVEIRVSNQKIKKKLIITSVYYDGEWIIKNISKIIVF